MKNSAFGFFLCTFIAASCPVYAQYAGQLPAAEPVVGHESVKLGTAAPKPSTDTSKAASLDTTSLPAAAARTSNEAAQGSSKPSERMKIFDPNSGKLTGTVHKTVVSVRPETRSIIPLPMPKGAKKGHWQNTMSMSGMPIWVEDP